MISCLDKPDSTKELVNFQEIKHRRKEEFKVLALSKCWSVPREKFFMWEGKVLYVDPIADKLHFLAGL